MALHDARETLAFADADDLDELNTFEDLALQRGAQLLLRLAVLLDLSKVPFRTAPGLSRMGDQRKRAELRLDVLKTELEGVVAVLAVSGLHLRHVVRLALNDCHGNDL